ncbi:hypothetical protein HDU76_004652 [Blyttiomyces sp. JEL0837]|nr:hypothetical protein HDU76_004652 [Blyttiomyces sp. JEL0837]
MIQLPLYNGPALPNPNNANVGAYIHQLVVGGWLKPKNNTYYAVHSTPNTGINCNTYCGHHDNVKVDDIPNQQTTFVAYGVLPYLAVTDPRGVLNFDLHTGAKIGDLCESHGTFSFAGSNGNSYTVPRMWSNVANACVE